MYSDKDIKVSQKYTPNDKYSLDLEQREADIHDKIYAMTSPLLEPSHKLNWFNQYKRVLICEK